MRRVAKLDLTPSILARALDLPDGMEIIGVEWHPDLFGVALLTVEGDMLPELSDERELLYHYGPDPWWSDDGHGNVQFGLKWPWTSEE